MTKPPPLEPWDLTRPYEPQGELNRRFMVVRIAGSWFLCALGAIGAVFYAVVGTEWWGYFVPAIPFVIGLTSALYWTRVHRRTRPHP